VPAFHAADSPDLGELKRRTEALIDEFTALAAARCRDGSPGGYLDARRDLVVADQLRQAAGALARAAHAEEVRAAVERRTTPCVTGPQRVLRRKYRWLRATQVVAGGAAVSAAAAVIGVIAGT
jgi:hypothetical protein